LASQSAFVVAAGVTLWSKIYSITSFLRWTVHCWRLRRFADISIHRRQVYAPIERTYIGHDGGDSCSMESVLAQRRERLNDHRVKSGLGWALTLLW